MNGTRQQIQYSLALEQADQGEAPVSGHQRTEPFVAKPAPESSAVTEQLMEEVCNRENLVRAWKRVRQNKGGPGVDGMTIDDAKDYLREHWPSIRSQLLAGTYQPQPVKRVEIPKPDGGVRKLGVPCVVDRLIQQALLQVLQGQWDPTFSEHSYGFRPGRSAHQAVAQAQQSIAAGYNVVVDLDLEKFFDRVNHDSLMARVAARVTDKRVLKLIRAFLKAGVMEDGLVSPVDEGTPQGGPLSPLLSNLVLDDLDKELTRRGHHRLMGGVWAWRGPFRGGRNLGGSGLVSSVRFAPLAPLSDPISSRPPSPWLCGSILPGGAASVLSVSV